MTQEETITLLFNRIRDLKVKTFHMDKRDAASDVQHFMRQCCRNYNSETYDWEDATNTETVRLLRQYLKKEKQYIKENNL